MSEKQVNLDSAKSEMRATVAIALSTSLITGIDECKETGHPLTQLQQIELAKMAVMSYDAAIAGCANLEAEWRLMNER